MQFLKLLVDHINIKTIILCTLMCLFFKSLFNQYFCNPRWKRFSKTLPGPTVYPIVGTSVPLLLGAKDGFGKLFSNLTKIYGPTFRLWIGKYLAVVVSDVNDVQTVLTNSNCLLREPQNASFNTLLGSNVIFASSTAGWKRKRKEYQPFFLKKNLLDRIEEVNKLNNIYIEKMKKHVDGPEFDITDYMYELSFDGILKIYFNYEINDQERRELNLCRRLDEVILRISLNWFFQMPILNMILQWILPVDVIKTRKMAHNFIDKMLNSIQKSPSWTNEEELEKNKIIKKEIFVQSYIGTLIKLRNELNEADLVHSELLTIIAAGIETTGVTMSSCFLALAAYPEIQEKVYQEIYRVFSDSERPTDASDLNKFPYLEQVIKETQRLFTVFPSIFRSIEKDIKIGSRIHPAGTLVMLNFGGIHMNPNIYPNPHVFNPDNFNPEAIKNRHRYSFLPFGAGPKNCLGKEYAELIMKLRVISFLRIFKFETNVKLEDIKMRAGIVETSSTGYFVSIKLRK